MQLPSHQRKSRNLGSNPNMGTIGRNRRAVRTRVVWYFLQCVNRFYNSRAGRYHCALSFFQISTFERSACRPRAVVGAAVMAKEYVVESVVSAPFDQVAYVVWKTGSSEALVADPGFDVDSLEDLLKREHLRLAAILNTHGHADHIAGNGAIKHNHPHAPLIIGANEAHLLTDPDANLSAPYGLPLTSPPAERLVRDGERLELAGISFLVREIPGHSPGSVVFIADALNPPFVLAGDVLFAGSVGRVDFPGGSGQRLAAGIRQKLFCLPDATVIYPGHGPPTTIGQERRHNPFVGERAGAGQLFWE
jgi:glyoxylase-like metal-dependent hydrolase (beta-lactamase superfamily II)